jgi:hypothetical protein
LNTSPPIIIITTTINFFFPLLFPLFGLCLLPLPALYLHPLPPPSYHYSPLSSPLMLMWSIHIYLLFLFLCNCSKLKRDSGPQFESSITDTDRLLLQKDEEVSNYDTLLSHAFTNWGM